MDHRRGILMEPHKITRRVTDLKVPAEQQFSDSLINIWLVLEILHVSSAAHNASAHVFLPVTIISTLRGGIHNRIIMSSMSRAYNLVIKYFSFNSV